jgi:hypothetical protein
LIHAILPTNHRSAAVAVFPLSLSPQAATVAPSGSQQFAATIQGTSNAADLVSGWGSAGKSFEWHQLHWASHGSCQHRPHTITATRVAGASATSEAALRVINLSPAAVLTCHHEDARDGAYLEEVTLTTDRGI